MQTYNHRKQLQYTADNPLVMCTAAELIPAQNWNAVPGISAGDTKI